MPKKYQLVALSVFSLFSCSSNAGYCQLNSNDADVWQNWSMFITPSPLAKYGDYPGSKLKPITRVTITYSQTPRLPLSVYEDLYYTTSQPIGCKRKINPINIVPGTSGIIKITAINSPEEIYAASNSALRAFVDLSLNSCMTKYLQVPVSSFDNVVAALCNMGLHRHSQTNAETGIAVNIQSDNGQRSTMLFQ